jgi:hypothetical protein
MMFASVSDDLTNLRHVQDAKLVFEPECTILGYQSCEASVLIHWTQNDVLSVSDDFTNLRHEQDAKLLFEPECTILGTKVVKHPF